MMKNWNKLIKPLERYKTSSHDIRTNITNFVTPFMH
jgi:hypothetical protein